MGAGLSTFVGRCVILVRVLTTRCLRRVVLAQVADLLDGLTSGQFADADPGDATAHLYVWLRYSSNRHITWQRSYNTQPRILSAAQDRLTQTIARTHKVTAGESQEWVRLMLGMLGRGGDGQKIRDEILNIMHRNGIKEVKVRKSPAYLMRLLPA